MSVDLPPHLGPLLGVEQVPLVQARATIAVPAASTRSASRWSWWVTPSVASIRNSAASARSIACERAHEAVVLGRLRRCGSCGAARRCRRSAAGRRRSRRPCRSRRASCPGRSCTTDALVADQPVEQRRLADVGPADDRDREDAVVGRASCVVGLVVLLGRERGDERVEQLARQAAVQRRDRDRVAEPEAARTPTTSASRRSSSTLLTTTITGTSPRCSTRATRASSSVTPTVTSTTSTTTSAR